LVLVYGGKILVKVVIFDMDGVMTDSENMINGIRAAKAAGMRCVAVAQSFAASELQAALPDCIRRGVSNISLADLGLEE
jgi:beta-phosphoglucomutase-like phosphatase (HAD superfamily)